MHRVQRVPVTEASGRIHTSAVTVAVLPEAEEVEVEIDEAKRPAHRRLPLVRARRPERQHDRLGRAHHPPPDRPRRRLPGREVAAQEQGQGAQDPPRPAARARPGGAGRRPRPRAGAAWSAPATARSASAPTTSRRTASPTTASTSPCTTLDRVLDGDLDPLIDALDHALSSRSAEGGELMQAAAVPDDRRFADC